MWLSYILSDEFSFFFFFKRSPDNIHNHFLSVLFQYSILLTLLISLNSFALCSMLQIRLWESDMNRVDMTPSYFYDEFPSKVKQLFIRLIAFHFFLIYYVYLFIFLGGLWRCLRLCTRIWWFTMGGFKEDAFACKGRNTHANERTFTPSKVENSTFGFPYTKVFFFIYIYMHKRGAEKRKSICMQREKKNSSYYSIFDGNLRFLLELVLHSDLAMELQLSACLV